MNQKHFTLLVIVYAIAVTLFLAVTLWQPVLMVDGYAPYRLGIARTEDLEADVICWTFNGLIFGSIYCMPRWMTDY